MFRNVPECSGMFHVPGFIDAPSVQILSSPVILSLFGLLESVNTVKSFVRCW